MSGNAEALRDALREMLEAWEEQFGEGACDCQTEPWNFGHVCQCCKARAALAEQPAAPTAKDRWRRWFAWIPVSVGQHKVWLETVERRRVFIPCHPCGEFEWEYRAAIAKDTDEQA